MAWSQPFDDPIPLPGGGELVTLKDAGTFITELPEAEQHLDHWQTAARIVMGAAEGRDFMMHAHIGMLRALNAGRPPPVIAPRRKRAKTFRIVR